MNLEGLLISSRKRISQKGRGDPLYEIHIVYRSSRRVHRLPYDVGKGDIDNCTLGFWDKATRDSVYDLLTQGTRFLANNPRDGRYFAIDIESDGETKKYTA